MICFFYQKGNISFKQNRKAKNKKKIFLGNKITGWKLVWLLLSPFIHPSFFRRDQKRGKNNQFVVHLLPGYSPSFLQIFEENYLDIGCSLEFNNSLGKYDLLKKYFTFLRHPVYKSLFTMRSAYYYLITHSFKSFETNFNIKDLKLV